MFSGKKSLLLQLQTPEESHSNDVASLKPIYLATQSPTWFLSRALNPLHQKLLLLITWHSATAICLWMLTANIRRVNNCLLLLLGMFMRCTVQPRRVPEKPEKKTTARRTCKSLVSGGVLLGRLRFSGISGDLVYPLNCANFRVDQSTLLGL